MNLPPLPLGAVYTRAIGTVGTSMYTYTADQMHAYAAASVAAERERCAVLCEDSNTFEYDDPGGFFARLIRGV